MNTYKIPCAWQMYGSYEIQANSIEEAIQKAKDAPLPETSEFLEGSFEIDYDEVIVENDLTDNEINKIV